MAYVNPSWSHSEGNSKIREIYSLQISRGYRWATNSSSDKSSEVIARFESQGLEVFVGQNTFDIDGRKAHGCVAILVREKK